MEKVLRCTVFLADMKDFTAMNEVYVGKFGDDPPTRGALWQQPPRFRRILWLKSTLSPHL